jgi:hypothetical protein
LQAFRLLHRVKIRKKNFLISFWPLSGENKKENFLPASGLHPVKKKNHFYQRLVFSAGKRRSILLTSFYSSSSGKSK